jgi:hypothetical protein
MATPLGVEFFTAVAGPLRLLDPKIKPLGPKDVVKAADVEARIEKELRLFLKAKSLPEGDEPEMRDYMATLETLSSIDALSTVERRSTLTAGLPDPALGLQYLEQCDKVTAYLNEALPRETWPTLTGDKPVEPSLLEQSRFWRAWEIAEDPLVVLRDLREGILVDDQIEVLTALWPLTYQEMIRLLLVAMADAASASEKWEVPFEVERQLETFMQISRLSDDLVGQLQGRARAAEQQEQAQSNVKTAPLGQDAGTQAQTPTQRVANR